MSKGDAEHAAQHQHGVVGGQKQVAPQTIEQRVAKLEALVAKLEEKTAGINSNGE